MYADPPEYMYARSYSRERERESWKRAGQKPNFACGLALETDRNGATRVYVPHLHNCVYTREPATIYMLRARAPVQVRPVYVERLELPNGQSTEVCIYLYMHRRSCSLNPRYVYLFLAWNFKLASAASRFLCVDGARGREREQSS